MNQPDSYYSRNNPRYGVTESFPPPRTFDMARVLDPTPREHGVGAPSSLRRRTYVAEAVRNGASNRRSGNGSRVAARAKRLAAPTIAAAALLLLAALLFMAVGQLRGSGAFTLLDAPSATENISTPREQWHAGALPFLYQTDKEWASEPYAGGTVEENGCGPTCLSMVYVQLTGRTDKDPAAMAAYSEANGHVDSGITAWSLMTEGAAGLGLHSQEVPANATQVANLLGEGTPIICSVGPGDFTTTGHFIVLAGLDEQGRAIVHDPNSAERSSKSWDIKRILGQCRNLWSFS